MGDDVTHSGHPVCVELLPLLGRAQGLENGQQFDRARRVAAQNDRKCAFDHEDREVIRATETPSPIGLAAKLPRRHTWFSGEMLGPASGRPPCSAGAAG